MLVYRSASGAVAWAPAKLNLFFEVLGRRPDGFHEVETLMLPITLFDSLALAPTTSTGVECRCRWAGLNAAAAEQHFGSLPQNEDNLAAKAVLLLKRHAESAGLSIAGGWRVDIVKRIPSGAGLGGGSSDAAAALLAANLAWNLNWPLARLMPLAAELGSDVPFFLASRPAVCRGRGEQIAPAAIPAGMHFVVARPPASLSTAAVYRACEPARQPRSSGPLLAALACGDRRALAATLLNRLESAAARLEPWIDRLAAEFRRLGCLAAQMSGSGTSYFGLFAGAPAARRAAALLRARRVGTVFAVQSF